jgi:hypothetical protein
MAAAAAQNGMTLVMSLGHDLPLVDPGSAMTAPRALADRTMELYG